MHLSHIHNLLYFTINLVSIHHYHAVRTFILLHSAIKTMIITKMDHRQTFMLFNHLVVSVTDYLMGILTLFASQSERKKNTLSGNENCIVFRFSVSSV